MTSLLDSTAHFSDRCTRLGLAPAFVTALKNAGIESLSRIAFIIGQPGQPILNQDVDDLSHVFWEGLERLQRRVQSKD